MANVRRSSTRPAPCAFSRRHLRARDRHARAGRRPHDGDVHAARRAAHSTGPVSRARQAGAAGRRQRARQHAHGVSDGLARVANELDLCVRAGRDGADVSSRGQSGPRCTSRRTRDARRVRHARGPADSWPRLQRRRGTRGTGRSRRDLRGRMAVGLRARCGDHRQAHHDRRPARDRCRRDAL